MVHHARADEFIGPFPSWKNVKTDFGAVGDGKADDTAALQKALNAMQHGVLYLPAGTYRITSGLTMTSQIFMNVIGENPETTIIKWDGPQGGTMLYCNGVRYSRFGRLTWNGGGKALAAVAHIWDGKTPGADTGNSHFDSVFENAGFGLRAGTPTVMDAEMSVLRCVFRNCSQAGISIQSMNALDWWIWNSSFENCKVGATNAAAGEYGGGNFHIYDSVFRGSTEADMTIGHTSYFGIRGNTSIGSNAFFVAKRPGVGRGAWKDSETWGAPVTLQDNVVIDPVSPTPILIDSNGPTFLLDNTFRIRAGAAKAPVVRQTPPGGPSDLISIGNTYSVADPLEVKGRVTTLDDKIVERAAIKTPAPQLPGFAPNRKRSVIEVAEKADAATIQQAIDAAAKLRGQRPVVHLPGAQYSITSTLVIPAGSDLQLVGDGYSTNLRWTGTGAGPVLRLQGPSRATLREFEVDGGPSNWKPKPDAAIGIVVENADQPGARIVMQGAQTQNIAGEGILADHLQHADLSIRDNMLSDCAVGIKVLGQPVDGRVAILSGITTDNELTYDVDEGGTLLVRDSWYEGAPLRFIHLHGSGNLTLDGSRIAPGRPAPNTSPSDPSYAGIDIDDFKGNATLISAMFGTRLKVRGAGRDTNVLLLGCNADYSDAWINDSPEAHVTVVNSQYQMETGGIPIDNQGGADAAFLRKMLALLRSEKPRVPLPVAEGKTDLRIDRVWVRYAAVGFHITK
jgi:hypothetical protein